MLDLKVETFLSSIIMRIILSNSSEQLKPSFETSFCPAWKDCLQQMLWILHLLIPRNGTISIFGFLRFKI